MRSGHPGDHPAPKQPAVYQAKVQGRGSATQSTGRVTKEEKRKLRHVEVKERHNTSKRVLGAEVEKVLLSDMF